MKTSGPSVETRKMVLLRDGYRCVRCGAVLSGWPGYSIHHRRMRSHAWPGLNETSNLICLCGSGTTGCHGWVHEHSLEAYKEGWLIHAYENKPETVPVRKHFRLLGHDAYVLLDNDGGSKVAGSVV